MEADAQSAVFAGKPSRRLTKSKKKQDQVEGEEKNRRAEVASGIHSLEFASIRKSGDQGQQAVEGGRNGDRISCGIFATEKTRGGKSMNVVRRGESDGTARGLKRTF